MAFFLLLLWIVTDLEISGRMFFSIVGHFSLKEANPLLFRSDRFQMHINLPFEVS